jgi:hypothetical protein
MVWMEIDVSRYLIGVCRFETTQVPQTGIYTCNMQIICLQYLKTYNWIITIIINEMFLVKPQLCSF